MGRLSWLAPPISSKPGCHSGGGALSKNPEMQLEEFLASTPVWMQRCLLTGFGSLNQDEIREWSNNLDEVIRLTGEYERILQLLPAKWKEYRKRQKREAQHILQYLVPKGKAGRKRNDELAERIWALADAGNTSRQIQAALKKNEINLAQEGIEYYRKTQRRPRKE